MTSNRPFLRSLSHPVVVVAVAVLLLNDHMLKGSHPSWLTGKLSDFAGLVFFPLLLAALIELAVPSVRRSPQKLLMTAVAVTGFAFAAVQLIPAATQLYETVLGGLQWPLRVALDPTASLARAAVTPDPTDLIAIPAIVVAWWIGSRVEVSGSQPNGSGLGARSATSVRPRDGFGDQAFWGPGESTRHLPTTLLVSG